jgi:hypothetical protein
VLRAVPDRPPARVVNTRPLLVRAKDGRYSLKVFDGWMSAPTLTGPWLTVSQPSAQLASVFKQAAAACQIDPLSGQGPPDEPARNLTWRRFTAALSVPLPRVMLSRSRRARAAPR